LSALRGDHGGSVKNALAVEPLEKFARALEVPLYHLFFKGEKDHAIKQYSVAVYLKIQA
jgi:hypothetical protein